MDKLFPPSRKLRILVLAVILAVSSLPLLSAAAGSLEQGALAPQYISPHPGAKLVSPGTTVAVRYDAQVDASSLNDALFDIRGSLSGLHPGHVRLAGDKRTVIFAPNAAFALGEDVTATVRAGMRSASRQALNSVTFQFRISLQSPPRSKLPLSDLIGEVTPGSLSSRPNAPKAAASQYTSSYLTFPSDFPNYTITVPANGVGDGLLFSAPWGVAVENPNSYVLIMDDAGQPIFYRPIASNGIALDFKRQPNGTLTYYDSSLGIFVALDNTYNVVHTYHAGNGYNTDLHDLQILPDGDALLLIYDPRIVDMSPVGSPTATVIGLVLEEVDPASNVVFEWRSWDHFYITDTYESLTTPVIDYVHGNAIDLDQDGNWLISSRHMNEVTKINRSTGDIIWRLGGKNNQFNFVNDPQQFAHQHDIRRLPNGNITLFDNHNSLSPTYSRGVEYQINEITATLAVTKVFEYPAAPGPGPYTFAMGDAQRLPGGDTLIGWGIISSPALTEVKPDGSQALQMEFEPPYISYREFRFPWQGFPSTDPTLVITNQGPTTTLAYSWNGATEIASYRVYAGDTVFPNTLIATQPRTGFEDHTVLVNPPASSCYFRVMPVDKQGHETRYSNEVHLNDLCTTLIRFFPIVFG